MPGAIIDADQAPAPEVDDALATEPPVDQTPARDYTVFRQHVYLDIDFRENSIQGRADIYVTIKDSGATEDVFVDARQCDIDLKHITVSSCPVKASYDDPYEYGDTPESYCWSAPQWGIRKNRMRPLWHRRREELSASEHETQFSCTPADGSLRVTLPVASEIRASWAKLREQGKLELQEKDPWDKSVLDNSGKTVHKISVPFTLKNIRDGLQFIGTDEADPRYPHLYTRHSIEPGTASSIFPCIDDPGCRSDWKISITFPRTLGDAFHQRLATQQQLPPRGNRKRKLGEDEPRQRNISLCEEDKLLEMTVVCSGRLEDESISQDDETKKTMTFGCSSKAARHIGFAVGPFEHVDLWSEFRSEADDEKLGSLATKIHGYCLPGRAEEVSNTCAALVTAIDHFVLTFGRYPFDSYKVCFVDDLVTDTVPLAGFSLCSTRMLYPEQVIDKEIDVTRILVHSLACQWFGVNIIPDRKADVWLVVGIAWFMTDLFMKFLCGNNEYRFRMKSMADKLVEVDINRPSLQSLGEHLHLGDFEVDFMNLKAPLVLFILDRRLSKSSGSAGITRIISKMVSKANTSGDASDQIFVSEPFRKHCEKYGQTRLESFWNQWVVGSGCPRFEVFQRFNKKRLCVEMTIRQTQDITSMKARPLEKDAFWRDVMEENHAVYAGELQHSFTGPMTIRIHEADGTPYEHIVEIREDSAKAVKFEIPYNTKYKRLKRNRRQRERQVAGNVGKPNEEAQEDSLLYSLGDVLQTSDDINDWGFIDWDEKSEASMDQESYEWIRMDADFEWICEMQVNLPAYMFVSQLQQDRDVVAQQDSMLFLLRESKPRPHPLISTILTRTLVDERYFYGLRTMAAEILRRHGANESPAQPGLKHLMKAFELFFYYEGTSTPRPNNFSDKRQYFVQCAITESVAAIRGTDGKCPKEARRFILRQLQCNDNTENPYSDHFYICKLIAALATCQIPDGMKSKPPAMSLSFGDGDEDDEMAVDSEPEEFKKLALEEIERYRRMDEYSPSYQNCFTVASLDALCRLMKAKVIPVNALTFVQYLQDRTIDVVRIKGIEALVELGHMENPVFLKFFLSSIASDPSPFVRDQLFKILTRGLASTAIGERVESEKLKPAANEGGLIVEHDYNIIEAKQSEKARKEDLTVALAALKQTTKDNQTLQEVIWDASNSPVISVAEKRNLLELCSILFEEDEQMLLKFGYRNYWTASHGEKKPGRGAMVNFKRHYRTTPRKTFTSSRPEPKRTITLNLNKAPSFSLAKATSPAVEKPPTQVVMKPTVSVTKPAMPAASPAVPTKPVVSVKQAVPTKPVVSVMPAVPTKPVVSVKQAVPTKPIVSGTPAVPNKPVVSVKPAVPTKPVVSVTPAVPTKSVVSVKPAVPTKPIVSGTPAVSTKPVVSVKPAVPTKPVVSVKPAVPTKPVVSGTPAVSTKAVVSVKPAASTKSIVSGMPAVSTKPGVSVKPAASTKPILSVKPAVPAIPRAVATPRSASPQPPRPPKPPKDARRDSIAVQPPRPSIEIPTPVPERKPLPHTVAPVKVNVTPNSALPAKTNGSTTLAPTGTHTAQSMKRHSADPAEPQRPTKIVKLNTKGIPASAFQKRNKIVKVKFSAWNKLKLKSQPVKGKPRTATPEAGTISVRSTTKRPRPTAERANSIVVQSPGVTHSPIQSTPPANANTSLSSPPLAASQQLSSTPTSKAHMNTNGVGSKPARKPLPSGERKPLPSTERKSLPSGGRTSLPSTGTHPSPTQHSAPSADGPPKPKIKLKVKTPFSK